MAMCGPLQQPHAARLMLGSFRRLGQVPVASVARFGLGFSIRGIILLRTPVQSIPRLSVAILTMK
jgi:hypothetical protein